MTKTFSALTAALAITATLAAFSAPAAAERLDTSSVTMIAGGDLGSGRIAGDTLGSGR